MDHVALVKLGGKYTLLYAGVTVFLVYQGSQVLGYAFGLAALVMLLGSLVVISLLFGSSDIALDTVEAGGEAGFRSITNPSQYRSIGVSFPSKIQFGLYLVGIVVFSLISLMIVL